MSLWYSILPYVKWCRKSEVENGMVLRLLQNCFLGLESRLCLPAWHTRLLKLSRVRYRVVTEGFCTLGLVSLVSSLKVVFVVPRGAVREWR